MPLLPHREGKPADAACLLHVSQIPPSKSSLSYDIWSRPTRTRRLSLAYPDLQRTYLAQTGLQDVSSVCATFSSRSTVLGSGFTLYSENDWDNAKILSFLDDITVLTPPVMPPPPPLLLIIDAFDFIPLSDVPDTSFVSYRLCAMVSTLDSPNISSGSGQGSSLCSRHPNTKGTPRESVYHYTCIYTQSFLGRYHGAIMLVQTITKVYTSA